MRNNNTTEFLQNSVSLRTVGSPVPFPFHCCLPEGIARAGGAVDVAREELQAVQEEHKEMSEGLRSLLERAMDLGLKSKVRGVR